mgnify:CR=1 FL=1
MNYKKWLYIGLVILSVSPVAGIIGAAWSVRGAFEALTSAENAGIGPVGANIEQALAFAIAGLIGSAVGVGLMIYAGVKMRNKS